LAEAPFLGAADVVLFAEAVVTGAASFADAFAASRAGAGTDAFVDSGARSVAGAVAGAVTCVGAGGACCSTRASFGGSGGGTPLPSEGEAAGGAACVDTAEPACTCSELASLERITKNMTTRDRTTAIPIPESSALIFAFRAASCASVAFHVTTPVVRLGILSVASSSMMEGAPDVLAPPELASSRLAAALEVTALPDTCEGAGARTVEGSGAVVAPGIPEPGSEAR
jgi:hypothetical protein